MSWTFIHTDQLRRIDLFANASEETLAKLATLIYTRQYAQGQRIFSNGAQARRMYFIEVGEVEVTRSIPGFESEVLAVLSEGSYFGESALILDAERSADALAVRPTRLGIIEGSELKALMRDDLDVAEELLWVFVKTLSKRLRTSNAKVTQLAGDMASDMQR